MARVIEGKVNTGSSPFAYEVRRTEVFDQATRSFMNNGWVAPVDVIDNAFRSLGIRDVEEIRPSVTRQLDGVHVDTLMLQELIVIAAALRRKGEAEGFQVRQDFAERLQDTETKMGRTHEESLVPRALDLLRDRGLAVTRRPR